MSQPASSSPSFTSHVARPITAKPSVSFSANPSNSHTAPTTLPTMAAVGTVATGHGSSPGANTSTTTSTADSQNTRPQFTFQFSAATEMILKRLRGEGGPLNLGATLGIRPGGTTGAVQPPGYEDVRRSVLQGMKTTLTMDIPPVTTKSTPKATGAKAAAPTSADARASPASGSGVGKGKTATKVGRAKAGTKRKRARDESDSADDSAAMSGLGDDSDSDGNGSVTNMPKQTLSGRKVVKPAQFNPAAVDGPTRKRGPYNYKRTGRSTEQALCKRCGRGHSPASNMIVFCDGCNVGWHQMCHDPMVLDELVKDESKEWFCNDCAAKRAKAGISIPGSGKDSAWLGKSLEEKRAYLSTFSYSHLVSLLLQATIMHPDIPIFPASNPSSQTTQQNVSRTAERRLNVYPQQPFPPSASTAGLFPRAEANPNAPINFIRKINPDSSGSPSSSFVTSYDHNPKPDGASNPTLHPSSSEAPALPQSRSNQPGQDEDADGEDESRASTPASPPYPRPGNGLMAKLPPDDQDLEWLVGEGEDGAAFSHVVFDGEGEAQKVDERGMTIAGQV